MLPNLDLILLEAQKQTEIEYQQDVLLARRYHEGDQDVYLNARALEFLGLHSENKFRLNICRSVVNAVLAELNVTGFGTGENDDKKPLAEFSARVWAENRMDAMQKDVHESALRDRESFVIVDWDLENSRPRLTWHQRFTSLDAGNTADESGCYIVYPDDDYTQEPSFAVQRWVEKIPNGRIPKQRQRMTFYYPDKIERYYYDGGWKQYRDGEVWPQPWVSASGKPLGIPVKHFRNSGLRPEAWDAIPMQDAVNKTLVDIMASADLAGFRVFFASGWIPTSDGKPLAADGSNALQIAPGQLLASTKDGSNLTAIDGASPMPLVDTLTQLIQYTAHVTETPASRFRDSGQVQSGDSQKEQNKPFLAKVDDRRVRFGNAWEDVMSMARRLENEWGEDRLDEEMQFSTIWKHSYSYDELKSKKELGVPQEQLWQEMGYDADQIAAMKEMDEYKAKKAAREASLNASRILGKTGA